MTPDTQSPHSHPANQTTTLCRSCMEDGEDALLRMAERIQWRRDANNPELLRQGYEAYKDWSWGDE